MKRILFTALALAFFLPGMAKAQATDGGTVILAIGDLLFVDVTLNPTMTLTPAIADFDATFIDGLPVQVETKGNTSHDLSIKGDTPTWDYNPNGSGNADPNKPVGDLGYKLASAGSFTAMTDAYQLVSNLGAGPNTVDLDFQVALDYLADVEGLYTMNYTVQVIAVP